MQTDADDEKYKLKLLACFLYVPVAQLSSTTFSEIERLLVSKSIAIHYRKIEIRTIGLTKGKEEYNSENLFSSDLPCRIIICFLESKNKTGDPKKNPFEFNRSWTVTLTSGAQDTFVSEKERRLEEKLLQFERQLTLFKSLMSPGNEGESNQVNVDENEPLKKTPQGKGKGRGKNTRAASASNIFTRIRQSLSTGQTQPDEEGASSSHEPTPSSSSSVSGPPPYSDLGLPSNVSATTKTVYIKQVELLLNGTPLDQIDTRETGII